MKITSKALKHSLLALTLVCVFPLTGCEEKGELEKAGENMDEAIGDVKRKVEDATD